MNKRYTAYRLFFIGIFACVFSIIGCSDSDDDRRSVRNPSELTAGLQEAFLQHYPEDNEAGLAHVTYWTLTPDDPRFQQLAPEEQEKVTKIQANQIHSRLFQPNQVVPGYEATGLLNREGRLQTAVLKVPENWNGDLVVAGTPGLRNEYANEAVLAPWLLEQGYAYVTGDKGLINGSDTMLSGDHPTQHWGIMMLDLARWAEERLQTATRAQVGRTYAVGLSNGGYQVRRALEIDHESVEEENRRIFDGGLDWSGAYWPDGRVLDTDTNGEVSPAEYAAFNSLIRSIDRAALAMGWAYSPDTATTPENWAASPRYPEVHGTMTDAGFTSESAVFWGYYNTIFDSFKAVLPTYKGVGYYNLVSYIYRAELRGDDAEAAAAYENYLDPQNPDAEPPLYDWLANADHQGWNEESVAWALKNANTGEFSAPLLTASGKADGLVAYTAQAVAYQDAVQEYGNPELYRLYTIENAGHVDAHADGSGDFDFNGIPGDEGMADRLTPMQAYVERAFRYLVDWTENGNPPPESRVIHTDPAADVTDPDALDWGGTLQASL